MKAYELLDSKDKWTQLAYARNKDNKACDINSIDAVKFCLVGAVVKCYHNIGPIPLLAEGIRAELEEYRRITTYLRDIEKTGEYPHGWNDRHTYEEVITLLKKLDI